MSTYTIRPTSVITSGGGSTPSSSATVLTNLGDASDTTSVTWATPGSYSWAFGLGSPSIASDEFVCRVGSSIRWSNPSAAPFPPYNNTLGIKSLRSTDSAPSSYPSKVTSGTQTTTTTEVSYDSVTWARSECSGMKLYWNISSMGSPYASTIYDLSATIYTIKLATCAPTAQTWTTSTSPTITVPVTATIDWESSTYDWQNLRKITVEVRIESGGTGVGTGTLKSSTSVNYWATSTGSTNVSVPMPDALTNGTYNIYSRAIRHRENVTTPLSDQIGNWSTGVTLTMNVTPPNSPTVSASTDQTLDRNIIQVTPVTTAGYTSPTITIQRSADSGATWSTVRTANSASATFGTQATFYDYEAPRATNVIYRARVNATTGGVINSSAWVTTSSLAILAIDWNLKVPENSSLNIINLSVIGDPTDHLVEDLGVFRALDRKFPIIVAGTLGGWDGELQILTSSYAEWNALKSVLQAQKILLLESPFGWSKYIRILSDPSATWLGTTTTPRRQISLTYVETDVP